jgi:hypothetical protein
LDILVECISGMGVKGETTAAPVKSAEEGEAAGRPEVSSTPTEDEKVASSLTSKVLNLLAYILSQPAIKCSMLQLVK